MRIENGKETEEIKGKTDETINRGKTLTKSHVSVIDHNFRLQPISTV